MYKYVITNKRARALVHAYIYMYIYIYICIHSCVYIYMPPDRFRHKINKSASSNCAPNYTP